MDRLPADRDGSERRVAPRMRTLKRARVLFNNRFSTIDCIVRNVSHTGALLTVDTAVHLPKEFEIAIGEEPIRPAKLVYRREMFAGIRFLDVEPEEDMPATEGLEPGSARAAEPEDRSAGVIVPVVHPPLPAALVAALPWSRLR